MPKDACRRDLRQPAKNPQAGLWALWVTNSLCREKDLRVRRARGSYFRFSWHNRGRLNRSRFHLREPQEQFFNFALLTRLGENGLCHDAILSHRRAKERALICRDRNMWKLKLSALLDLPVLETLARSTSDIAAPYQPLIAIVSRPTLTRKSIFLLPRTLSAQVK